MHNHDTPKYVTYNYIEFVERDKKKWKQNIHPHSYLAARCTVPQARVLIDLFPHLFCVCVYFFLLSTVL